ncbi:HAMP domain-containing protein, partial [Streptomyces sp. URMC 126]|uniref:HAMP domain-containing protein n=1 Tax=Streptomyces sp. URMC 126 TaxID=3423401 RepID=UPI003F1D8732
MTRRPGRPALWRRPLWRRPLPRLPRPRGLRVRLIVGFVVVAAASALTAAALTFREARAAILDRARDSAVHDLRVQTDSLAPDLPAAPGAADLRALTLQLDRAGGSRDWRTAAAYRDASPVTAASPPPVLPTALREAAPSARTAVVQRFHHAGTPWLAVALPVVRDGEPARPSGLVVYASFSLADQERDVRALVAAARAGALPVLPLSVVPALLAARRVLRPVRRLRSAAENMAAGALDTRIRVTGDDELADLGRTFNTMAATLQADAATLRAMEARARRFAADVSHELRTPLAAMTAVTGVLDQDAASGRLDPETAEALELVAGETGKLVRLVEDLMEISRFDAGAATLDLDDVDVPELLHKTLALRHWGDRVGLDVPPGLRARLDPRRVDVVLANLIGNALRHGGPGGPVRVRVRAEGAEVDGGTPEARPRAGG